MLRATHVPDVMARVEAVLGRASRSRGGARGVHYVVADDDLGNLAALRHLANLQIEFHSGSDRPVVGPAIRVVKRAVRRSLRWYIKPIIEQQVRFNHATLDVLEKLRVQVELFGENLEEPTGSLPGAPDEAG